MGSYVPNSKTEREEMLKTVGVSSIMDLFSAVPSEMLLKDGAPIPEGLSEIEVAEKINEIADKNSNHIICSTAFPQFLGHNPDGSP